jgi:hypothetical protein
VAIRDYLDFVLVTRDVQKSPTGVAQTFMVSVFDSPVGQGQQDERIAVPDGLTAELARLESRALDSDADWQMEMGQRLADLLFPSYARELLRASLARLRDGEGLRVRLRLADELADFPWEYVYIPDARGERTSSGFLALNPCVSIVRHEAVALPADWFNGPGNRRVVIAMASPEPYEVYPRLSGLPTEQAAIKAVFDRISGIRAVYLPEYGSPNTDIIPGATWRDLMAVLTQERTDVFHFAGHGQFVTEGPAFGDVAREGWIILADERNQAFPLPGERLAELLRGTGVRLVMLGACQTGRRDNHNVWSSVAAALLKAGIPAVVAMQFTIGDQLAVAFSEAFYRALVAGLSVDEAVSLGRQAIRMKSLEGQRDAIDWGVPVLYLRAHDVGALSVSGGGAPTHQSALAEEQAFLDVELAQRRRNLLRLRQQKAVYAEGEVPLRLLNQIDAEKQAVQDLESRVASG